MLNIGETAPDFELPNKSGETVCLTIGKLKCVSLLPSLINEAFVPTK